MNVKLLVCTVMFFTGLGFANNAAAAQASVSDELRDIASCREIPKSGDRLRCFDRTTEFLEEAVTPIATADDAVAEPSDDTVTSVAAADAPEDDAYGEGVNPVASFGAEDLVPEDRDSQLKVLRAVATKVTTDKRGKFIFELDNGQVWRQLPGDTKTLRLRKDREGDGREVVIKKRSLGAYALRVMPAKRSILVRRIK